MFERFILAQDKPQSDVFIGACVFFSLFGSFVHHVHSVGITKVMYTLIKIYYLRGRFRYIEC